ncbi:MAG: EamA family transporter RarD [Ideonella sp.]|nr:EamA family transporter RarD [Ideonella sp.]
MSTGPLAAAAAYILWGVFPLYIRQIEHVGALEIVLHRSVWSLLFVLGLLAVSRRFAWLRELRHQPRVLATFALTALLLSGNWLLYVWAVNAHRVLDASLGYFINPLFNVMLGYVVLHERPRPWQWAAVALAAAGVVWLTVAAGQLPWVSLVLAASFGTYGLLRKTAALGAVEGLALETGLLAPLALGGLVWLGWQGRSAFGSGDTATDLWLLAAGPFTAVPLLLFAMGARRVSMATLGLLQYLGPSIQFVLAIWLYHEPFSPLRGIGFALIWAGLVVYSAESLWRYRQAQVAAPT